MTKVGERKNERSEKWRAEQRMWDTDTVQGGSDVVLWTLRIQKVFGAARNSSAAPGMSRGLFLLPHHSNTYFSMV